MVATIIHDGIELALRNRLTSTAVAELAPSELFVAGCYPFLGSGRSTTAH
jgi:hypothetical protein